MRSVRNRVCQKLPGCPAFSCDNQGCLGRSVATHRVEPPTATADQHHHEWYRQARWSRIRASQLAREPLCERCRSFDQITPAVHVDHVVPHKGEAALFFDPTNLQSLCPGCHTVKTQAERRGIIMDFRNNHDDS